MGEKLQRVALACFLGFIKSFLGNSTGLLAKMQLQCSQATYKLQEELLRKINRTSRNKLVPHSVFMVARRLYPYFKIVCVWPFGLLDYGSATLRCKI